MGQQDAEQAIEVVAGIQAQAVQELSKDSNSKIVLLPSDVMSGLSGGLSGLGGLVSRLAPKD